jgi:hypothetical protein
LVLLPHLPLPNNPVLSGSQELLLLKQNYSKHAFLLGFVFLKLEATKKLKLSSTEDTDGSEECL